MVTEKQKMNLKSFGREKPPLSREQAVENGKKGATARNANLQARRSLREAINALLQGENGQGAGYCELAYSIYQKAKRGDVQAFNSIRDLIGEKPSEKHELAGGVDPNVKAEIIGRLFNPPAK
jgi:hypothetical protein